MAQAMPMGNPKMAFGGHATAKEEAKEAGRKDAKGKKREEKEAMKAEPPPVEFEEIVNSMPVTPFWKIPVQKVDVPFAT